MVTTVELMTVDPGTLVKSTTNWNVLVAARFVTVPVAVQAPDAGVQPVMATSERTLSAGSKATTLLGAMTEVRGVPAAPGSEDPGDEHAVHAIPQTTTRAATPNRARPGRIVIIPSWTPRPAAFRVPQLLTVSEKNPTYLCRGLLWSVTWMAIVYVPGTTFLARTVPDRTPPLAESFRPLGSPDTAVHL